MQYILKYLMIIKSLFLPSIMAGMTFMLSNIGIDLYKDLKYAFLHSTENNLFEIQSSLSFYSSVIYLLLFSFCIYVVAALTVHFHTKAIEVIKSYDGV